MPMTRWLSQTCETPARSRVLTCALRRARLEYPCLGVPRARRRGQTRHWERKILIGATVEFALSGEYLIAHAMDALSTSNPWRPTPAGFPPPWQNSWPMPHPKSTIPTRVARTSVGMCSGRDGSRAISSSPRWYSLIASMVALLRPAGRCCLQIFRGAMALRFKR